MLGLHFEVFVVVKTELPHRKYTSLHKIQLIIPEPARLDKESAKRKIAENAAQISAIFPSLQFVFAVVCYE